MKTGFTRHGGPYDRGSADAYYGRPFRPHYFIGDTYQSPEVLINPNKWSIELQAYKLGYDETPKAQKDYGVLDGSE